MSDSVFANKRSIAGKSTSGKTIAAFPDVCFTPPQTPATPPGVPIPYPNTGQCSDTADGSKSVKIGGKEAMLKDKSSFKTSTGNDAGSAPKKGVVTSKNTGKVFFNSWSMNVRFEGENVCRHLDLTTHNHASKPGNSPPMPHAADIAAGAAPAKDPCAKAKKKYPVEEHSKQKCPAGHDSHHVLQNACFENSRGEGGIFPGYSVNKAPCVCLEGPSTTPNTEHYQVTQLQNAQTSAYKGQACNPKYSQVRSDAKKQLAQKPKPGLSEHDAECVLKEVDKKFEEMGIDPKSDPEVRTPRSGPFKKSVTTKPAITPKISK